MKEEVLNSDSTEKVLSAEANLLLVVIAVRLVRVFSTRVSLLPAVATASLTTRSNGRSGMAAAATAAVAA